MYVASYKNLKGKNLRLLASRDASIRKLADILTTHISAIQTTDTNADTNIIQFTINYINNEDFAVFHPKYHSLSIFPKL